MKKLINRLFIQNHSKTLENINKEMINSASGIMIDAIK